jgi:protein-tyrosine phosphatase
MQTRFFAIDLPALGLAVPGRLATAAKPDPPPRLQPYLHALRQAGVDIMVSALTPAEARRLGLEGEPQAAAAAGIDLRSCPIPDFSIPRDDAAVLALADELAAAVRGGAFVVCHCRGGRGRSTLLAGAVLIRLGIEPDAAIAAIARARGRRVPEGSRQRRWLRGLA